MQVVRLRSIESINDFLSNVPREHYIFIRELDICTKSDARLHEAYGYGCAPPSPATDTLVDLLRSCTQLRHLSLSVGGSLGNQLIPCFAGLRELKRLTISNWADEDQYPL